MFTPSLSTSDRDSSSFVSHPKLLAGLAFKPGCLISAPSPSFEVKHGVANLLCPRTALNLNNGSDHAIFKAFYNVPPREGACYPGQCSMLIIHPLYKVIVNGVALPAPTKTPFSRSTPHTQKSPKWMHSLT
jgi:hypothetical protein